MELSILHWIQITLTNPFLDTLFSIYTQLNNHGELWIGFILCLCLYKPTRRFGFLCALALLCEYLINDGLLKNIIMRPRPFSYSDIKLLIEAPKSFSFPSGHSASSFVIAGMFLFYKQKGRWLILILALLMGFSRLYLFVHYPSDVLIGALLGIVIAYSIYQMDHHYLSKKQ